METLVVSVWTVETCLSCEAVLVGAKGDCRPRHGYCISDRREAEPNNIIERLHSHTVVASK